MEQAQESRRSPGDIKRRQMELGSQSRMDCLAAELLLNSCFLDTILVTLLHTAVKTVIRGAHRLLRTGGVPTSLTMLFWRCLTVSSVFTHRSAWTSYSSLPDLHPPLSLYLINLMVFVDVSTVDYLLAVFD